MGSRQNLKAKTLDNLEKQNKNEESSGFAPGFTHPSGDRGFLNLERDSLSIFRIMNGGVDPDEDGVEDNNCTLGLPLSDKGRFMNDRTEPINPGENQLYIAGWCNNDQGKNQPVVFPSNIDDFNKHIFTKAIRAILDYKWDAEAVRDDGEKGMKKYTHAGDEMHTRVAYNGEGKGKYSKEMLPVPRVMMNVIDRLDPEFHAETGLCKIATDNGYTSAKTDKFSCDPCINLSTYKALGAALKKEKKVLDEIDIAYYRYSQKTRPTGQQAYADITMAWMDRGKAWNEGGKYTSMLREETWDEHPDDAKLELIDLSKFVKPTAYKTIEKGFKDIFKAADRLSGGKTDYYGELQALVAEEAKTKGAEAEVKAEKTEELPAEKVAEKAEEKEAPRARRGRASAPTSEASSEVKEITVDEFMKLDTVYKFVDKLDDEDLTSIKLYSDGTLVQVNPDTGKPFAADDPDLASGCMNDDCDFPASALLMNCPKCGKSFE